MVIETAFLIYGLNPIVMDRWEVIFNFKFDHTVINMESTKKLVIAHVANICQILSEVGMTT